MSKAAQAAREMKREVSNKLAAEVSDFEKRFTVVHDYKGGPKPAYAPTGDLYVDHAFGLCADVDDVIFSWKKTVEAKAAGAPDGSALYWRVRPEIDYFDDFGQSGWMIYCRFIISNKPGG